MRLVELFLDLIIEPLLLLGLRIQAIAVLFELVLLLIAIGFSVVPLRQSVLSAAESLIVLIGSLLAIIRGSSLAGVVVELQLLGGVFGNGRGCPKFGSAVGSCDCGRRDIAGKIWPGSSGDVGASSRCVG